MAEVTTSTEGSAKKKGTLTMKILVDKKSNKVIYGEAGKEVVDFLINLLTLPIGAVSKLLEASNIPIMVGSSANLHKSVQNIRDSYLHKDQDKNSVLFNLTSFRSPVNPASSHLLLDSKSSQKKYYRCSHRDSNDKFAVPKCSGKYVTDSRSATCPTCKKKMTEPVVFVDGKCEGVEEGGIVKGVATYMVMDDLTITPLSTIAGIGILNKLKISTSDVEERTVEIGMDLGVKLLKALQESKTVLSDVFMAKKEKGKNVVSSAGEIRFKPYF